jgi:hypothetical protein
MTHISSWIAALAVAAFAQTTDPPGAPVSSLAALPPRALMRIGTDLLRAPGNIRSFAISPDGRLAAAGDLRAPSPRMTIFDVPTGRRVKQFVAPGNGRSWGWVETAAFSPDGTKLLWGEMSGEVALWDLETDRLLFRHRRRGRGHPPSAGGETQGDFARFHDADARTFGLHARRKTPDRGASSARRSVSGMSAMAGSCARSVRRLAST